MTCPGLTLSPFYTRSFDTFPGTDVGTSAVIFSASTSISAWPFSTSSPTLTLTSMTSPLATLSPRSGSLISLAMNDISLHRAPCNLILRCRRGFVMTSVRTRSQKRVSHYFSRKEAGSGGILMTVDLNKIVVTFASADEIDVVLNSIKRTLPLEIRKQINEVYIDYIA